jgi:hypothetical protein
MRQPILRLGGGKRRRRLLLAVVASAAALGVFAITNALAVHDLEFQLDGNVVDDAASPQDFDWANFFDTSGNRDPELPDPSRPDFDASSFDSDFVTNPDGSFNTGDSSTFATGSKDTLPITGGWECNQDNNVNSKDDVMNAYAVSYVDPVTGDEILYFGLERNANTGTGNVGFWFLQDEVACESEGDTTAFTGDHADGDLLIVSEFSSGGRVSTIFAYEWEGGADGSLNETAVASGAECPPDPLDPDTLCAIANTASITTPWPTANKQDGVGDDLRRSEFFEGGINLTAEGLGGKCFNTFIADTRTSTSLESTIFDFSLGELGACTSETETTPSITTPTTIPATGTIDVTDNATVTVNGADEWSGTLKFFICGPIASGTCAPGSGDQLGSTQTVTDATVFPVTSATATITEAGRYCFRAEFGGDADAGVPSSEDSRESECFVINPRPTTLVTQGNGTVAFGQAVTDTATLAGTANRPGTGGIGANDSINPTTAGGPAGGSITFTLYKSCGPPPVNATGTGTNPQTVNVSGDATYGPVSFTPDAPGTYFWVATYSGDSPNTLASDSPACGVDPNETVIVQQIPTQISTKQKVFPNDSATIKSTVAGDNLPTGGTVTFRLYGPTNGVTPKTAEENCLAGGDPDVGTGGLLYKEVINPVPGGNEFTVSTDNTTVAVDVSETYFWRVTYATGDQAHTGRQSNCVENTVLTFNNDAGPGTLFPPAP